MKNKIILFIVFLVGISTDLYSRNIESLFYATNPNSTFVTTANNMVNFCDPNSIIYNEKVTNITCKGKTDGSISLENIQGENSPYQIKIIVPSKTESIIEPGWEDVINLNEYPTSKKHIRLEEVSFHGSNPGRKNAEILQNNGSPRGSRRNNRSLVM